MTASSSTPLPRVVIIGGGFAGLQVARQLRTTRAQITLIDRRNFHLFQPLLYQVATGGLSPANIAAPLRDILKRQRNASIVLGEVHEIDVNSNQVRLRDGQAYAYDYLVIATGVTADYFGNDAWAAHAPGLKTIEDATDIRRRVLSAFELAEIEQDPAIQRALLRFIVVGGGPTGVELAGALGEISHQTLKHNFRTIDPSTAEIILIEPSERVLEQFSPRLSGKAEQSLTKLGVTVRTGSRVVGVGDGVVTVRHRDGAIEELPSRCILWAAGVKASPLGALVASQTGVALDRAGRVLVAPDLSIPGHDRIFVIGDLASLMQDGRPVPGVAPAAMQEGRYVARRITERIEGRRLDTPPFRYHDRGSMATIGRSHAVVQAGRWQFHGVVAWLIWLFIHIVYLIQFTNRVLVMIQWGWNYFTRNRYARLITGER